MLVKIYMIIALSNISGGDWRFERQVLMTDLTDKAQCEAIAADFQQRQLWHKIYCVEALAQ